MDDYLSKPVAPDQLFAAIRRARRRADAGTEDASSQVERGDAGQEQPTNIEKLRAIVGPNADQHMPTLLKAYLNETHGLVQAMQGYLHSTNLTALRQSAHKLKSSSAIVTAESLAAWCQQVETLAQAGDIVSAQQALVGLEREYTRVAAALEQERTRMLERAVSAGYQVI